MTPGSPVQQKPHWMQVKRRPSSKKTGRLFQLFTIIPFLNLKFQTLPILIYRPKNLLKATRSITHVFSFLSVALRDWKSHLPEESRQVIDEVFDGFFSDDIVGPVPPLFTFHQPGFPQNLKVLGHRRFADPETPCQRFSA